MSLHIIAETVVTLHDKISQHSLMKALFVGASVFKLITGACDSTADFVMPTPVPPSTPALSPATENWLEQQDPYEVQIKEDLGDLYEEPGTYDE